MIWARHTVRVAIFLTLGQRPHQDEIVIVKKAVKTIGWLFKTFQRLPSAFSGDEIEFATGFDEQRVRGFRVAVRPIQSEGNPLMTAAEMLPC